MTNTIPHARGSGIARLKHLGFNVVPLTDRQCPYYRVEKGGVSLNSVSSQDMHYPGSILDKFVKAMHAKVDTDFAAMHLVHMTTHGLV